jgi:2-polyprenyl-3-methyl-5-hydroxy-6-metoxy-1,4-benzoquinol methylase
MIEAATRLKGVERLIDREQYFVIHAARQSGKTTYLRDLTQRLNSEGKYYTLYCTLEKMQKIIDPREGIPAIVNILKGSFRFSTIPRKEEFAKDADFSNYADVLFIELVEFCMKLDKPLVLLFDEVDCMSEDTLILFLRQLRGGYNTRDTIPFVHSIALVGMRNISTSLNDRIRDYKAKVRPDSESLGSYSPFNISKKTYTLKNFTKEEIISLYQQHTDDTGQLFEDEAIDYIYEQTQGQPWLVNAVATEVIEEMLDYDYSIAVTAEMAKTAIQTIIFRRDTHIDSLLERLKEERVRSVIEPMILGEAYFDILSDDYQYVTDLGLIKSIRGKIQPSNPIYGEVIIRTLSFATQEKLTLEKPEYMIPRYLKTGKIDINYLLKDFQQFWRENSDIWIGKVQYKEAAPHLILQGFLQRVLNGGGHIIRDMSIGKGRLDLGVVYEGHTYPIEIKLWKGDQYYQRGLEQIVRYMDVYGCTEGWLVFFDQSQGKSWEEKIYYRRENMNGAVVHVFGT